MNSFGGGNLAKLAAPIKVGQKWLWGMILFGVFIILGVTQAGQRPPLNTPRVSTNLSDWLSLLFFPSLLVLLFCWVRVLSKRNYNKQQQRYESARGGYASRTITITEEGIVDKIPDVITTYRWPAFTGIICNEYLCALAGDPITVGPVTLWLMLPRHFFEDGDWASLIAVIEEKVQNTKD